MKGRYMTREIKLEKQFQAVGADGKTYTVQVLRGWTKEELMDKTALIPDDLAALRTTSGLDLNRLQHGKYQVVTSGLILTSTSTDAV